MKEVSRHKSLGILSNYVRNHELFRDHAGVRFSGWTRVGIGGCTMRSILIQHFLPCDCVAGALSGEPPRIPYLLYSRISMPSCVNNGNEQGCGEQNSHVAGL